MAKYKILVIAHCLLNNQIANFGDIIDESQLTSPAQGLVNAGFIEEVLDAPVVDVKETAAAKKKREADEAALVSDVVATPTEEVPTEEVLDAPVVETEVKV